MDRQAIKDFAYGGTLELIRNRKFYYHSSIDLKYSHWTEEGKKAIEEWMSFVGHLMLEAEERDLNQRSREMIIKGLKGENKES